jgi:phosphoserine phosphatase
MFYLTLLASSVPLSIVHIGRMEKYIEEHGIGLSGKPQWLEQHETARLSVQNAVTIEQMRQIRGLMEGDRIDIFCTPADAKPKKLLLADMDATIVEGETLDELAARAGIKDQVAAITARAMNAELDFHAALRERVSLLKGLPVSALKETLHETVLNPGAAEMVAGIKKRGGTCVLVSGGFTFFTEAIAAHAGFDCHHGNILNHDGRVLDGTVGEPIMDKESKLAFLKSYAGELGIGLDETIAIGDGANDLPMLSAAGLGVGYRPKPVLEENLLNVLKFADLDKILYVCG